MAARKKRISQGGAVEQIVLAVAKTDYDDDRDGASFMVAEQRRCARALAGKGLLRIVSDTKAEVVAALTAKGDRLIAQRKAAASEQGKRLPTRSEIDNAERSMRTARTQYQEASDWFQRAKRQGPQKEIDRAYVALGQTAAAYESTEQHLNELRAKQAGGRPKPTLLQKLMREARGGSKPAKKRAAKKRAPKKRAATKPKGKLFRMRLVPRDRGNLVEVHVNGSMRTAEPAGGAELVSMRGLVKWLREANPGARFDLPGGMKREGEIVTRERLPSLYSWGGRKPRPLW